VTEHDRATPAGVAGHWDRYWAAVRIAACFEGADGNYEQEIRGHWENFFGGLPAAVRVLDIVTGNGAILMIARRVSEDAGLELALTGIDAARIDTLKHLGEMATAPEGAQFHGAVDAAALPFEDSSSEALCAQYSVEYMSLEPPHRPPTH
jgi:ubiquinone/menaquinone biosynthesis C-methylase UbiE